MPRRDLCLRWPQGVAAERPDAIALGAVGKRRLEIVRAMCADPIHPRVQQWSAVAAAALVTEAGVLRTEGHHRLPRRRVAS